VTWAAFGSVVGDRVIGSVLDVAFGKTARPAAWTRKFWPRYNHPDTDSPRGPEPDLVLDAPGWRYVVEAKWRADIDGRQGADGRTSQLAMRAGVAREVGDTSRRGVLVIVPGPSRYAISRNSAFARFFEPDGDAYRALPPARALEARAITWERVTETIEQALGEVEVVTYLRWRLNQLSTGG
jgi:hypothetical protein